MRDIRKIIVHCSDSDHVHHDNIETIRKWHVEENGWSDIGYHYVIPKDGEVEPGRPVDIAGAHTRGHNRDSIGICLLGARHFSIFQRNALVILIESLLAEYGLDKSHVYGHRDFDKTKSCPNFNVQQLLMWEY